MIKRFSREKHSLSCIRKDVAFCDDWNVVTSGLEVFSCLEA